MTPRAILVCTWVRLVVSSGGVEDRNALTRVWRSAQTSRSDEGGCECEDPSTSRRWCTVVPLAMRPLVMAPLGSSEALVMVRTWNGEERKCCLECGRIFLVLCRPGVGEGDCGEGTVAELKRDSDVDEATDIIICQRRGL